MTKQDFSVLKRQLDIEVKVNSIKHYLEAKKSGINAMEHFNEQRFALKFTLKRITCLERL